MKKVQPSLRESRCSSSSGITAEDSPRLTSDQTLKRSEIIGYSYKSGNGIRSLDSHNNIILYNWQ